MRKAVLWGDPNSWEFFLALSGLEEIQKHRRESFKTKDLLAEYNKNTEAFEEESKKAVEEKNAKDEQLVSLRTQLFQENATMKERVGVLESIHELYSANRQILVALSFYSAADESWEQALKYIRTFLDGGGRLYGDRMSLGLLEACILHFQGDNVGAQDSLEAFLRQTKDPWFQTIGEYLLGKQTEEYIKEQAGERPENLIVASTILGFWNEGSGNKDKAIRYYKEALGTFFDIWLEYDFAKERLRRMKQSSE
jgi:tetratricopeptide (TPR) repeat protein